MKHLTKLNMRGIAHHFALAVIVVAVAIGGTYYLVASHADAPTTEAAITTAYNKCVKSADSKSATTACGTTETKQKAKLIATQTKTAAASLSSSGTSSSTTSANVVQSSADTVSSTATQSQIAAQYNSCSAAASQQSTPGAVAEANSACGITMACQTQAIDPGYDSGTDCSGGTAAAINQYDNVANTCVDSNPADCIVVAPAVGAGYQGCTPSYSGESGASANGSLLFPVPCAKGVFVEGNGVWYTCASCSEASYIGPTGEPIYTQAQFNKLEEEGKAPNGGYTIIGTGNGSIPTPPASVTNGKVYAPNSNPSGANDSGLIVENKNVEYDGVVVAPAGKALYTQSQFNALAASKQKSLEASGDYAIVADTYASLAGGQTYSTQDNYTSTQSGTVSDLQLSIDNKQCGGNGKTITTPSMGACITQLEDAQQLAAQRGTVASVTGSQVLNGTAATPAVAGAPSVAATTRLAASASNGTASLAETVATTTNSSTSISSTQSLADGIACRQALSSNTTAIATCLQQVEDGQAQVANGGKAYKSTQKLSGSGTSKQYVTVSVKKASGATITVATTGSNGKTTTTTTTVANPSN